MHCTVCEKRENAQANTQTLALSGHLPLAKICTYRASHITIEKMKLEKKIIHNGSELGN